MKSSLKKKLDLIPLLILIISAAYLIWTYLDGQILFLWKHLVGLIFLAITSILFFKLHKLAVISLGLLIILGLFGILSFSPEVTTLTFGKSLDDLEIPILRFQPIFLAWATIHFVLSGRYYIGVVTKKYWSDIKSDEPFKI